MEKDLWVHIPAGRFWMGAQKSDPTSRNYDEDADPGNLGNNEWPVHEVELSEYWIGKYPITVCQYKLFIEDRGYEDQSYWKAGGGFGQFKTPDKWEEQLQHPTRPVVYISWYEAMAYAEWNGCRLPTEAQWERASRGSGDQYRKYPWGNIVPDKEMANFNKSNIHYVTPVGIFPESCSPEGIIDMGGNVWEWCFDLYSGDYQFCLRQGVVRDPMGPDMGYFRVVRGGAFVSDSVNLRCTAREWSSPSNQVLSTGFRVVRSRS
jgi:formylglycine-generating enzyme required for sulfatase activity